MAINRVTDKPTIANIVEGLNKISEIARKEDKFRTAMGPHVESLLTVLNSTKFYPNGNSLQIDPSELRRIAITFADIGSYGPDPRLQEIARGIKTWIQKTNKKVSLVIPLVQYPNLGESFNQVAGTFQIKTSFSYPETSRSNRQMPPMSQKLAELLEGNMKPGKRAEDMLSEIVPILARWRAETKTAEQTKEMRGRYLKQIKSVVSNYTDLNIHEGKGLITAAVGIGGGFITLLIAEFGVYELLVSKMISNVVGIAATLGTIGASVAVGFVSSATTSRLLKRLRRNEIQDAIVSKANQVLDLIEKDKSEV